ncbi:Endonuclease/Exonuclease/phosphatase family protein [Roseicitreum antarcticum]|uniref:Endonuclease/Exonuclease/phosphatase family protein n=1 Tax=Roseicitreum antarcticum TaxID=564137 RepID=A0A1H2R1C0_9RHOB|nr:Endonuclease/Exonuclease/phosphatase family protein [Roseicitreum antarcticum]
MRNLLANDPVALRLAQIVSRTAPDVLVLTKIDHDMDLRALRAFAALVSAEGHDMPHAFARRPNTGWATGRDMDGDGTLGTADDAHGYGAFAGVGGMAVLSRLPIMHDHAEDFSTFLWADLPGHIMPIETPEPALQRLSTTGHWLVPVQIHPVGMLNLLVFYASPPVFGSMENRNLHRNHDEVRFWTQYLDGRLPMPPPDGPVVVAGSANLDPVDGDGLHEAMQDLLRHPRLQDPQPRSVDAILAADHPASLGHRGDPALDTTEWVRDIGPGNLRVDYLLPDARLQVLDAGVVWPPPQDELADLVGKGEEAPTRHRLVWVDLAIP